MPGFAERCRDWTEKTSTDIARRFDVIRVEDLNIKGIPARPGAPQRAAN